MIKESGHVIYAYEQFFREGRMSDLPLRVFGRHEDKLSILGFGGGHIGRPHIDDDEAVRLIQQGIDEGISFFDNSWDYNDGLSERRMGRGLRGRRDRAFLMTKVCSRDKDGAEKQLHESLKRLETDYVDLWQFHEINYGNDPEWIFAPGGAAEAAEAAVKAGKVRYVGFTGHKDPAFLLRMLEYDFPWSALQMPVTILDPNYHRSFIRQIIPEAKKRGIAVLGMKSVGGRGQFVRYGKIPIEDCLRFSLSQDICCLVSGIDSVQVLEQNLRIVRNFQPMDDAEQKAVLERYRDLATDGRHEWYRTMQYFDGPYHREQHGFVAVDYPTIAPYRYEG